MRDPLHRARLRAIRRVVDDAETIAHGQGGPIMRLDPLTRRRVLAEAVLNELRRDGGQESAEPTPVPVA